ncbi:MAG: hypothetical protein AAGB00_04530 [Planctomycetota bacterium]
MKVANAAAWSALGRLSAVCGAALSSLLLALLATPDDLGRFLFAQSIAFVVGSSCLFGISHGVILFLNNPALLPGRAAGLPRGSARRGIAAAAVFVSLGLATLAASVIAVDELGLLWRPRLNSGAGGWPLVATWAWTWSLRLAAAGLLRAQGDLRGAVLSESVSFNALLVLLLVGFAVSGTTPGYRELLVACNAFSTAPLLLLLFTKGRWAATLLAHSGEAAKIAPRLVTGSAPMLFAQGLPRLANELTITVVGLVGVPRDVAVYGLAFRASQFVNLPVSIFSGAMTPVIARLNAVGRLPMAETELRWMTQASSLAGMILAAIGFGACVALEWAKPGEYSGLAMVLAALATGRVLATIIGPADVLLSMAGRQRMVMMIVAAWAAAAVGLAVVVTPLAGLLAMAGAQAAAATVRALVCWRAARGGLGVRTDALLAPTGIATARRSVAGLERLLENTEPC